LAAAAAESTPSIRSPYTLLLPLLLLLTRGLLQVLLSLLPLLLLLLLCPTARAGSAMKNRGKQFAIQRSRL
jgi:hypothetical protein